MEYETIHVHVFEPHRSIFKQVRNNKAWATIVQCNNAKHCQLFSRGQCLWCNIVLDAKCPYGRREKISGFTRRARNYHKWIKDIKAKYDGVPRLEMASNYLAVVGDYVYLPYAHMTMCKSVPFRSHSSGFVSGDALVRRGSFTPEAVRRLVEFKPHALMGGEITSYQLEQVPLFIKHLNEYMPNLFSRAAELCPQMNDILAEWSNVGREAILETLTPNTGQFKDIHGGLWTWDGKYLRSTNAKALFMLVQKINEIAIVPEPGQSVKVTDEDQVNENTQFVE